MLEEESIEYIMWWIQLQNSVTGINIHIVDHIHRTCAFILLAASLSAVGDVSKKGPMMTYLYQSWPTQIIMALNGGGEVKHVLILDGRKFMNSQL